MLEGGVFVKTHQKLILMVVALIPVSMLIWITTHRRHRFGSCIIFSGEHSSKNPVLS